MVAIALPLRVQRHDEQVALLQLVEDELAVAVAIEGRRTKDEGFWMFVFGLWSFVLSQSQHSITQGATQLIQDAGLQQKGLDVWRLPPEDFFHQIVDHKARATG